jgi:hypothetical protein
LRPPQATAIVDSDSVNPGSNPGPPAKRHRQGCPGWRLAWDGGVIKVGSQAGVGLACRRRCSAGWCRRLVASEQLNVTQAAAGAIHILGGGSDEGPASRMGRATVDSEFGEQGDEPVDDAVGAHRAAAI